MWKRCQPTSGDNDDSTGTDCIVKYHAKNNVHSDQGSGDRRYQGKCPRCQALAEGIFADNSNESLLNIISALSDKFDVVNKIQLPRLNWDLAHIKHVSEKIAKQNVDILQKLSDAEKTNIYDKRIIPVHSYRKRNLNLTALGKWTFAAKRMRQSMLLEKVEHTPIVSPEKTIRYRVRRRSYTHFLSRIINLLNRKLVRSKPSSKQRQ